MLQLPFLVLAGAIGLAVGFFLNAPVLGLAVGILVRLAWMFLVLGRSRAIVGRRAKVAPINPEQNARLNLSIEDLCLAGGFPKPELRIIKSQSIGVMAYGLNRKNSVVAITIGAQKKLDPVEFEAALAHILCRISLGITSIETYIATTASFYRFIPGLTEKRVYGRVLNPDSIMQADLESAKLTRYPPALVSALEKMSAEEYTEPESIIDIQGFKRYSSERINVLQEFWNLG